MCQHGCRSKLNVIACGKLLLHAASAAPHLVHQVVSDRFIGMVSIDKGSHPLTVVTFVTEHGMWELSIIKSVRTKPSETYDWELQVVVERHFCLSSLYATCIAILSSLDSFAGSIIPLSTCLILAWSCKICIKSCKICANGGPTPFLPLPG